MDKQVRMVPNAFYFERVKEVLAQAKTVKIPVTGTSMLPFLREGDIVALSSPGSGDMERGKIVLAYFNSGYVLHRVVRATDEFVDLAGDNNLVQLERININDVIAVVRMAYRNAKPLPVNTTAQVLKAWLWYQLRPLRYLYRTCCIKFISKSE